MQGEVKYITLTEKEKCPANFCVDDTYCVGTKYCKKDCLLYTSRCV